MDTEIANVLKEFGITEVKVHRNPRGTYYCIDKGTGEIREMPNLPMDAFSMNRYLAKGYKLDPKDLSQSVAKAQEGYTCQDCGKVLSTRLALAGHSRTHTKKSLLEVK